MDKKNRILIKDIALFEGKEAVQLRGWVCQFRSSGKIAFLSLRDGSGDIQCVFSKAETKNFEDFGLIGLETALKVSGQVKKWKQGFELLVKDFKLLSSGKDYPISKKSHGVDFLLNQRHLWLRSKRQRAILQVRDGVIKNLHEFFQNQEGFVQLSAPVLQPYASEGTSSLFPVDFFEKKGGVFLSQSGQFYMEAGAAALGRVYCFGPTFRAEKSSTRRHLLEFWMLEPEMAFCSMTEAMDLAERMLEYVVQNLIRDYKTPLILLDRDLSTLEKVRAPFPRLSYREACKILQQKSKDFVPGSDIGGKDEGILSEGFDRPLFVHHYPKDIKAFYMKEDAGDPSLSLSFDLLASESYGELIGGSEREDNLEILEQNIKAWNLDPKPLQWYLDLRRYGSFPHSGFGLGLERMISWICGLDHVREAIPFPRLYGRAFFENPPSSPLSS